MCLDSYTFLPSKIMISHPYLPKQNRDLINIKMLVRILSLNSFTMESTVTNLYSNHLNNILL